MKRNVGEGASICRQRQGTDGTARSLAGQLQIIQPSNFVRCPPCRPKTSTRPVIVDVSVGIDICESNSRQMCQLLSSHVHLI